MARRRKRKQNPGGLGVIIGLAVVGGVGYIAYRAWGDIQAAKKKVKSDLAKQKTAIDESIPGPQPSSKPGRTANNLGFTLETDCSHMTVTDQSKFMSSVKSFFLQNRRPSADSGSADFLTRRFFAKYFASMAPGCLPSPGETTKITTVIVGPGASQTFLPIDASPAQQCMYAWMFFVFAFLLIEDEKPKGWDLQTFADETNAVVEMLRNSGVSEATWNEVFQNSIPMDDKLREALAA